MGIEQFNLDELSEMPREHIPDEWAHRGHCPVCQAKNSLDVLHIAETPDQFVCQSCATAFELQSKGNKIRVMTLPEVLKPAWMDVINRWMTPEESQRLYQRYASTERPVPEDDALDQIPETTLSDKAVMLQALELQRLGSNFEKIEMLLFQAGAAQRQVNGALKRLQQTKAKENQRRGCIMWVMGIAALVIFGLFAGFLWLTSTSGSPDDEINDTEAVDSSFPLFDPAEVMTELAGIPTPHVVKSGPGITQCPGNPSQAAELFSGEPRFWSEEHGFRAWAMVNTGTPSTIRIPQNMVAGYMKMDSLEMITVQGPATISNLNFIVITCE